MKKWIIGIVLVVLALVLFTLLPSGKWSWKPSTSVPTLNTNSPASVFTYEMMGLRFQSPIELPKQTDMGATPDTVYSVGIPSEDGKLKFNFILAKISSEEASSLGNDTNQILTNAKTTYAGVSTPATEKIARTFFGKPIEGGKQSTKIPKPSTFESYLVVMPNGQYLFVGAKFAESMPAEQANQIMEGIAKSLQQK